MSKIETNVVKPQINFTENLIDYILITEEAEQKLDTKSQEITDFINNNDGKGKSDEDKDKLYVSIALIESYMPTKLTEAEIDSICIAQSLTVMKDAMAYFKEHHFKQYDARYLSSKFK